MLSLVFGKISAEIPEHQVLKTTPQYEIRKYPACIRAEVEYEGDMTSASGGFRILADYIFGKNIKSDGENNDEQQNKINMTAPVLTELDKEEIAMTAPVLTKVQTNIQQVEMTAPVVTTESNNASSSDSEKKKCIMSFTMPSKYKNISDLPTPVDKRIKLVKVPEKVYAVEKFSGLTWESVVEQKQKELIKLLKTSDPDVKVDEDAKPVLARYNPPFTIPFLRTNEIMIPRKLKMSLMQENKNSSTRKYRQKNNLKNNSSGKKISSSENEKPRKLTQKQIYLKQNLEKLKEYEELITEWQEKLFETVHMEILRDAAKYMSPHHYQEVIEERNADKLCGYPICDKKCQEIKGQFRISNQTRKIYDITELKCFCSKTCYTSSKYYEKQLSVEPIYMRNLEVWREEHIDILPLNGKSSSLTTNNNKNSSTDPSIPADTEFFYDAIEGFRIDYNKKSRTDDGDGEKPKTTFLLQKKPQNTSKDDTMINNKKTPQEEKPLTPQKKVQKKKRTVVTEMSLFGKIWTALDRMTSKNTRQYFVKLMRINIFTVKIMECFKTLKEHLHITISVERELIDLMSTFKYDTTSVITNSKKQLNIDNYRLAHDIPQLHENIFPSKKSSPDDCFDSKEKFKNLLGNMNLTIEELDAFVRVLRIGST
ncbi:2205_t:CDS:10 [Entrophospora sp. SA101]|nr:2205_t:CDS:10 [Entrophospora sp. SA101]